MAPIISCDSSNNGVMQLFNCKLGEIDQNLIDKTKAIQKFLGACLYKVEVQAEKLLVKVGLGLRIEDATSALNSRATNNEAHLLGLTSALKPIQTFNYNVLGFHKEYASMEQNERELEEWVAEDRRVAAAEAKLTKK